MAVAVRSLREEAAPGLVKMPTGELFFLEGRHPTSRKKKRPSRVKVEKSSG